MKITCLLQGKILREGVNPLFILHFVIGQSVDYVQFGDLQFLTKLGSKDIFGEIGVIFNVPQPFTVRTKRLSQVIRMSHHHFKQMVQPLNEDGRTIISNFVQVWNY